MGNRGQRIPDWQLHPLKHKLVHAILRQTKGVDVWRLYRALLQPLDMLRGRPAMEAVTAANFHETVMAVSRVLDGQGAFCISLGHLQGSCREIFDLVFVFVYCDFRLFRLWSCRAHCNDTGVCQ